MNDQPKTQWSGVFTTLRNGVSINENFTFRSDDWDEVKKLRMEVMDKMAPSTVKFPDDDGSVAHTETQETAPLCPVHGTPMTWRPAGVSKVSNKPYPAFWACGTKNTDGSYCKGKPKHE
jgi:hypothetical protein